MVTVQYGTIYDSTQHNITNQNIILVFVCLLCFIRGLVDCTETSLFPPKMSPHHKRQSTLANQLSHIMPSMFVCVPSLGNFTQNFVKSSVDGRDQS